MGCGSSSETSGQRNQERHLTNSQLPQDVIDNKPCTWSRFEIETLNSHNQYRAKHGVPSLILNRELCTIAQKYAEKLAKNKAFEHSDKKERTLRGKSTGENLYWNGTTSDVILPSGSAATKSWYDEIKDYNYKKPGFSLETGHFTQVVWADTNELGMGWAQYTDKGWNKIVVVANYYPTGNYQGRFPENVYQRKK